MNAAIVDRKQLAIELESLIAAGWRFCFVRGEWEHTRPLDRKRWDLPHPSDEITETLLAVACGELCDVCLKAPSENGRPSCFRCWVRGLSRHEQLETIAFDDCGTLNPT